MVRHISRPQFSSRYSGAVLDERAALESISMDHPRSHPFCLEFFYCRGVAGLFMTSAPTRGETEGILEEHSLTDAMTRARKTNEI